MTTFLLMDSFITTLPLFKKLGLGTFKQAKLSRYFLSVSLNTQTVRSKFTWLESMTANSKPETHISEVFKIKAPGNFPFQLGTKV